MFAKISYTWRLMGASWDVLKSDKALLVFPLLSGLSCLAVMASFAIPIWLNNAWEPPKAGAAQAQQIAYYGTLFLFYLANFFVITFFNTAIISCAVGRMAGDKPSLGDGFRAAVTRLPQIAGWSLVSATVGLLLRLIEDRSEKIGQLVAGLFGMAWTVTSYLVVPILVVEGKGPFASLKESSLLLKKTWGEQLIGGFSFGLVFSLLAFPVVLFIPVALMAGNLIVVGFCIALAVLYLVTLSLVQAALQSIFQAAVYLYLRSGNAPAGFPNELISGAMQSNQT